MFPRKRRDVRQPRRLSLETLESRQMMAVGAEPMADLELFAAAESAQLAMAEVAEPEVPSPIHLNTGIGGPEDGRRLVFTSSDEATLIHPDGREEHFVDVEVVRDPNRIFRSNSGGISSTLLALVPPDGKTWIGQYYEFGEQTEHGQPIRNYFVFGFPAESQSPPTDPEDGGATVSETTAAGALVVGAGPGESPVVRTFDPITLATQHTIRAFERGFTGGVRVTTGDINGDGTDDIIAVAGNGGGPHVRVFDGVTGQKLAGPVGDFFAFDRSFRGGLFVASGDIDGDGRDDIIVSQGRGDRPVVRVFSGRDGQLLRDFVAYDEQFTGGVAVAVGDVNGDGRDDIVTGASAGGGPHVRAFSGRDGTRLRNFFAYDRKFTGGVSVAAGDVDGDGKDDIVTGAGPGGGPHLRVFSGADGHRLHDFFTYDHPFTIGSTRPSAESFVGRRVEDVRGEVEASGYLFRIVGPVSSQEYAPRRLNVGVEQGIVISARWEDPVTEHSPFSRADFPSNHEFLGGVNVVAADLTGDGRCEIITTPNTGGGPNAGVYDGVTGERLGGYFPNSRHFPGVVAVAPSNSTAPIEFRSRASDALMAELALDDAFDAG